MSQWIHVAVVAASVGCLSTLLLVFLWRWCHRKQRRNFVEPASLTRMQSLQAGISRLHNHSVHHHHHQFDHQVNKTRGNNFAFRRGVSGRPLFSWSDHPSLAADAVENGWSRFAFTGYKSYISSPSKRSALLGVCVASDNGREAEAEIDREVCQGSADFMQKFRLNSGLKRVNPNAPSMSVAFVIRTTLPLPGPPLGNHSFPQEAYFDITSLNSCVDNCKSGGKAQEGEKIKLIQDNSNAKGNLEALLHVMSGHKVKENSIML